LKSSNSCPERFRDRIPVRNASVAAITLLCLASFAFGLDPTRRPSQYVHDTWGPARGFIGGAIYSIRQSPDGYLWIGTERGLVRFDGFDFTLLQNPMRDGLPIGRVRGLTSDPSGTVWIRLEGPGLISYRDGKFEDPNSLSQLQGVTLTATANDFEGRIYLAGTRNGVFRYSEGRLETILDAEKSPRTVVSLAATRDESVWLGTEDNGLYRLRDGHLSRVAQELKDVKINCLLSDENRGLWVGTDHGIRLLQDGRIAAARLPALLGRLQILSMARDHDGNVWVGTNHGIVRMDPSGNVSLEPVDLKSDHDVTAIYEDFEGEVWFGGSRGLERLTNGMFTPYSAADGLTAGGNGAVYVDSTGRTWIAPDSGGLYWMKDGHSGRVTLDGIDRDVVYSISGAGDQLWVGRQHGGLTELISNGTEFTAHTYTQKDGLAQNSVYSVKCDSKGRIWAGTISGGLSDLENGRFTNYSTANGLLSDSISSIETSVDGTVWVATASGLSGYSSGKWTNYTSHDGLPSSMTRTIFEDTKHVLWIASDRGLASLSSGHINVPPNLPTSLREQIFGIGEDGIGSLWFSTSDHVLRVNEQRLLDGTLSETDVQNYGSEDGLTAVGGVQRDHTVASDRSGRLWISLVSGLYMADPIVTSRNAIPVTARIESVSAGGRELDLQSEIRIPSRVKDITVAVGGSSLAAPQRVRFRYQLKGSGQDLSDIVPTRQIVFTNLGPGHYVFRIVASDGMGLWNGPVTERPFIIEPSFWQTWWFRLLCGLALSGLLWALYIARLTQVTAILRLRHQERLLEREEIARDLHDTFFQAVQSLFLRFDTATHQLPLHSNARDTLEEVLDDSDRVMAQGREMFLDIPKHEIKRRDLSDLVAEYCAEFAAAYPVEYRVEIDGERRALEPMVMTELTKITREALYNAFRHAEASAIEVEINYGKRLFRLRVRDNGKGFEPEDLQEKSGPQHLGLQNMRKRADRLSAKFELWSRPGLGTEVETTLAAERAYAIKRRIWPFYPPNGKA
jgi:ligand-binding sensor domain-containing protein/signal transduction histidine kinase